MPQAHCHASVYSLALRVRRICSTEAAPEVQFGKLAMKLRRREYSEAVIQASISRARSVSGRWSGERRRAAGSTT